MRSKLFYIIYLFILFQLICISLYAQSYFNPYLRVDISHIFNSIEDTAKVNELIRLCLTSRDKNPVKALHYGEQALATSQNIYYEDGIVNSLDAIVEVYYYQNIYEKNYAKALGYFLLALKFKENTLLAESNGNINVHYKIILLVNSIGYIYFLMKNYEKAMEHYQRAVIMAEKAVFNEILGEIYNNIGSVYSCKNNYEQALDYYLCALEFKEKIGNKSTIANTVNNIGVVFQKKGDYNKALQYYEQAISIYSEMSNKSGIANELNNIGEVYFYLNRNNVAEGYFMRSLQIAREIYEKDRIIDNYGDLAKNYSAMGQFVQAYKYAQKYIQIKDSLINEETVKSMSEMQVKYETEKKEKEIEIQKILIQKKDIQLFTLRITAIFIVAIFILLAVLFYNRYRMKQKSLLDKMLINEQKIRLKTVIDTQEKERQRIAKDLHDGVGQSMFILKTNLEKIYCDAERTLTDVKNIGASIKFLDEANAELRNIALEMMPRALSETGLAGAINDLLDKTQQNTALKYNFEIHNFEKKIDENIEIGIFRVFQEILSNILKHAGATEIVVQLFISSGHLILIVEDNGKGFELNSKSDMERLSANRTNISGMGLRNIAIRTEALNGTFSFEPSSYNGTVATVRIPLNYEKN